MLFVSELFFGLFDQYLSSSVSLTDHHTADRYEETYEFEFSDSISPHPADRITFLSATQQNERKRRKKRGPKEPSLVMALARSFGGTFFVAGVFKLLQDLLNFVSPQLLK